MDAGGEAKTSLPEIQNLNLNEGKKNMEDKCLNVENDSFDKTWGFNLKELYKIATTFLKEHEGKAFHASYKDKLQLIAYTQQVTHGKYTLESSPPVGYLDVIGKDRKQAWAALGDLDQNEAMEKFINLLDSVCPLFHPFVKAHKLDLDEKEKIRKEVEEKKRLELEQAECLRLEEEARRKEETDRQIQIQQKRLIQDALNQQTFHQFKTYAEQQHPGNPEQQASLIRQLQTQHYQQYMQQVLERQFLQQQQSHQLNGSSVTNPLSSFTTTPLNSKTGRFARNSSNNNNINVKSLHKGHLSGNIDVVDDEGNEKLDEDVSSEPDTSEEELDDGTPPIASASMWTRKEISEFKESIRQEGSGDSVIRVGHGETVTVRVPTHSDGSCLFWEFATDSYDIGFGVYFEWTKNPGTQVSVHISESEDTDDEDTNEENVEHDIDVERGGRHHAELSNAESTEKLVKKPPISVIIPVYRRDCHEEVYAGSHAYPGQGVYLLKFDNSYSLWRSKSLYYRVYYTR